MHPIRQDLLELMAHTDISKWTLKEISKKVGVSSPQGVSYHLKHLRDLGYISKDNVLVNPEGLPKKVVIPIYSMREIEQLGSEIPASYVN